MVDLEDITKVAKLAKIRLTQEEIKKFSKDLAQVFEWAEQLDQVCLQNHSQLPTRFCPMVADVPSASVDVQIVLSNAPERHQDYFVVPSVLGDF
ncbi:Asp-tRNA(Asn)/Glu-tRNA(Gln) amidotransferase subunit GatC [Holospora curviuscula]|uniref:Glutamyl-tRNA(Gln) amidotransferase subunit C n=1 Tax=Holospora curviuscula TaxID=1082868 RepID=A0A2S5R977_9PROT|nr:Asp-tRNA(Asn)/Glu-tRNA(Gln) amidotransferase subunit GatC [Holospora curviuscula]PPE03843.1 Glutamyl-tRNA(Gln) amidotransferase subunit C [Holospora curviuscula]